MHETEEQKLQASALHSSYDVIVVGGAIMGSSVAFHLKKRLDFPGRILVVERDLSYEFCSTSHTNSCIRQQFTTALNIRISQYGARCIKTFRDYAGGDERLPDLDIWSFGYLYLASTVNSEEMLRKACEIQHAEGIETQLLTAQELKERYSFLNVSDIRIGSLNLKNEGYWDGGTIFQWFKRLAQEAGVEYIQNEVKALDVDRSSGQVTHVALGDGTHLSAGLVINAAGPRASIVAQMAGIALPVSARKRYSWIFTAARPLCVDLPLIIDPEGFHVRDHGGGSYLCGGREMVDHDVDVDDFTLDHTLWEEHVWPRLASRIPTFEQVKLTHTWAGHYAMNNIDHNAIIGPHPDITNFLFINGFSGHGLQQAPAMGQALAEHIALGRYETLDMTPFHFARLSTDRVLKENAII